MTVTLHCNDARTVLGVLPEQSVHCVVTSPPYFGLRVYALPPTTWGGDSACEHDWVPFQRPGTTGGEGEKSKKHITGRTNGNFQIVPPTEQAWCQRCDAWRGWLGLEPTPELYVEHIVAIFQQVKRVLRCDGTLWLNLGDSYAGSDVVGPKQLTNRGSIGVPINYTAAARRIGRGLPAKSLLGIPWRVAFALQADGWLLRNDIIWHRTNTMPESVRDRLVKAHEYVFLFTQQQRYYFDAVAAQEPAAWARWGKQTTKKRDLGKLSWLPDRPKAELSNRTTRSGRTVWNIPTQPYHGAHFAVFPERLVERCLLPGCPPGGTVLDPFAGSGTTLLVAERHGRNSIGIEASTAYVELIRARLEGGHDVRTD